MNLAAQLFQMSLGFGKVSVLGLDGLSYLDKVENFAEKTQSGPVVIDGEVDRIYKGVSGELVIDDASLGRRIRITSSGCSTAVIWNPWQELSTSMADMADNSFETMVCVESTIHQQAIELSPGSSHTLSTLVSVSK